MKILLCVAAAVICYLLGGMNPSTLSSAKLFHRDIRGDETRNPGVANDPQYIGDYPWAVICFDILKGMLLAWLTGLLFSWLFGYRQLGAAFACFFTAIGHAFPVWYGFRGGKSAAIFIGAMWFIDWRASIVVLIIFLNFLILKRYLSLAVIGAAVSLPILLAIIGTEHGAILVFTILTALLIVLRHHENLRRISNGSEAMFTPRKKNTN